MASRKKTGMAGWVYTVIALLLILAVVGLALKFGQFDNIFPTALAVHIGETKYAGTENTLILPQNGEVRVDIQSSSGYSVKVIPNVTKETDFNFSANGVQYSYFDEMQAEFTAVVIGQENIYQEYFVIDCTNGRNSLEKVLSRQFGNAEIELYTNAVDLPFKLVISTAKGQSVEIAFGQKTDIQSLELSETYIIF